MAKGNIIPELHLSTLQKFIEKSATPPSMVLSNKFPVNNAPSDTIEWESRRGSAEMIPFVARNTAGPSFGEDGVARHSAKAASFASTKFFDEEFLNNLRMPGTPQTKMRGQSEIARSMQRMLWSIDRRREWLMASMAFNGSMTYTIKSTSAVPEFASLSWGIPSSHQVTLGATARWYGTSEETANRDIFGDVFAMKNRLMDSLETEISNMELYLNSRLLQSLVKDSGIRDLIQTQNISDAQLVANPAGSIAQILGVGAIVPYDAHYNVTSFLAQNYTSGTTIYVHNATDFAVGGDVYLKNTTTGPAGPRATITAIDTDTGAITISDALTGVTGVANKSQLEMRKWFLPSNRIVAMVPSVDGQPIAEMLQAPHGMSGTYGKRMYSYEENHPEGIQLVAQDLCLPVLYRPEAIYMLNVGV
jgi:hypothetical protein